VPAHEGLVPQERFFFFLAVRGTRFNVIRTSRTRFKQMVKIKQSDRCIAFYSFDGAGNIVGVPCKKWSCPICQKMNARLWAWRAQLQYDSDDLPWYMITLTLGSTYGNDNPSPAQVRAAYAELKKLWNRLRMAMVREYDKKYGWGLVDWPYLAFVEGQPKRNGIPHFHIISALPAPFRIKDFAVRCGFGYMADEKVLLSSKRAAAYVAKYASKGAEFIPKDFRRVRASRTWAKLPEMVGRVLFVKSRTEHLSDYFIRVSNATGASVDSLWQNWQLAHEID